MKKIIPLILISALLLAACGESTASESSPTVVAAEMSESSGYTESLSYTGYAAADETKNFSFLLSGKISEVCVEKGEAVKAGQVLAKLDTESVQLAIDTANDNIRLAENQISQVNTNIAVQKLTLEKTQIGIDAEKLTLKKIQDSYNSQINTIMTNYNSVKADYDRAKELYENGYISETDFEDAQYALDTVTETLNTAKSNMENDVGLEEKSIESMENDYKLQEQAVKNSEDQLSAAQISLSQAKTALESANKNLTDSTLYSTVDGYVTAVVLKAGEVTSAGTPVVCVKSGDQVINVGVGTADYPKLSTGMKAEVSYNGDTYEASITNIALYPDETTRTYNVEITPQNCNVAMGTLVNVQIPIGESEGCFIPISSVFNSGGVDYVYVLEEDGYGYYRTVRTEVILGTLNSDKILAENLETGVYVVTDGVTDIYDNQQVSIKEGVAYE
ncbi:MAG: efflux RND transporter periplasmic adaptor subunit [Eubacterium sp.]|nr:efflux RND transporter periplasmic adaptor subunit [Eubacterium sp.]